MPGSRLEDLYYALPAWLQNGVLSLYGLKLARVRYSRRFFTMLRFLKKSEWWSPEQIEAYQDERVRWVVRHAYETVPFYRRWYDAHGIAVRAISGVRDLTHLPILTKETVRQHHHEMVSTAYSGEPLIQGLTSGTTGTPLTIYQTKDGVAFQWAIWWRHKARFGLRVGDRHLVFGARVPVSQAITKPPYWRHDRVNNRVYLSAYHISKQTAGTIVDYLNATHFDFFTGYPSAMYALSTLMEDAGLLLTNRPKYIVAGADALTPEFESSIRRAFGVAVTEQYGMAEFAGNMSKCEAGRFHVDFECCYLEREPIPGHAEQHRLVFTGWGNPAMPFIRYEVGDFGSTCSSACPCGRSSLCLASIDGRLEDFVVTPDGRKVMGVNQVLEYARNAKLIQVYQRHTGAIELRIVPANGFGEDDKQALLRELRRRVGRQMAIDIHVVDGLEPSPTGKFRAVISEVCSA